MIGSLEIYAPKRGRPVPFSFLRRSGLSCCYSKLAWVICSFSIKGLALTTEEIGRSQENRSRSLRSSHNVKPCYLVGRSNTRSGTSCRSTAVSGVVPEVVLSGNLLVGRCWLALHPASNTGSEDNLSASSSPRKPQSRSSALAPYYHLPPMGNLVPPHMPRCLYCGLPLPSSCGDKRRRILQQLQPTGGVVRFKVHSTWSRL